MTAASSTSPLRRHVVHISDVEGSWLRLSSFVDRCPGVYFDKLGRLVVDDDTVFVFGGDAVDRGPWSRRVVRTLLEAKLRQPEQVVLIGGNRDINKLRLPRELAGAVPKRAPPELLSASKPTLLRWIFNNTMGAQPAFDFRQQELKAEGVGCSDDDVVASFLADLAPHSGEHFRFLQHAQLAYRHGGTLFVHGGIATEALGHVPGEARHDDVDGWIAALNGFYGAQIALYAAAPRTTQQEPAWLPIILYQAPVKGLGRNPHSVVYGRFGSDAWNNPRLPSADALRWLKARGITRVVVGHTPVGDVPAVLRGDALGDDVAVEVVVADNSRGRVEVGTVVSIDSIDDVLGVDTRTRLDDDRVVDVRYRLPRAAPTLVGTVTSDGRLIKAVVDDTALLFRSDEAFAMRQTQAPLSSLGTLSPPTDPTCP
ncbi:MAG TPA: metallophosphoesterase [Myxococcota bacterium]